MDTSAVSAVETSEVRERQDAIANEKSHTWREKKHIQWKKKGGVGRKGEEGLL
jgi:hypothetical protein